MVHEDISRKDWLIGNSYSRVGRTFRSGPELENTKETCHCLCWPQLFAGVCIYFVADVMDAALRTQCFFLAFQHLTEYQQLSSLAALAPK